MDEGEVGRYGGGQDTWGLTKNRERIFELWNLSNPCKFNHLSGHKKPTENSKLESVQRGIPRCRKISAFH